MIQEPGGTAAIDLAKSARLSNRLDRPYRQADEDYAPGYLE
jgi:hypothetical protein